MSGSILDHLPQEQRTQLTRERLEIMKAVGALQHRVLVLEKALADIDDIGTAEVRVIVMAALEPKA